MRAGGDAQASDGPQDKGPEKGVPRALGNGVYANYRRHVDQGNEDHHRPSDVVVLVVVGHVGDTLLNEFHAYIPVLGVVLINLYAKLYSCSQIQKQVCCLLQPSYCDDCSF